MTGDNKLNTDLLVSALENTETYEDFLSENKDSMGVDNITVALRKLSAKLDITPLDAINNSELDRAYGYQIFNGTRKPSRNKLIQISIGMNLSLDDCNYLLKCGQKQPLYAKSQRDAIIIYALTHNLNIIAVNELLYDNEQQPL